MVYDIPKLNPDRRTRGPGALRRLVVRRCPSSASTPRSTIYAGLLALLVNLLVAVVVTLILRAMKVADGVDGTAETDYTAEREDPTVRDLPDPLESAPPGVARRSRGRSVSPRTLSCSAASTGARREPVPACVRGRRPEPPPVG